MIITTEIERAQWQAVHDDVMLFIDLVGTDPKTAINMAQIAANNLSTLISQATIGAPMPGIPVAPVQKCVDDLLALIAAETHDPPPPPAVTQIVPGDGKTLTDSAAHVWSFGFPAVQDAYRGSTVLRDGNPYASGVARKLVLAEGIIWAEAGRKDVTTGTWWMDTGTGWAPGGAGPALAPPPPPTGGTASPDGTTITAPTVQSIIDARGRAWTFANALRVPTAHNPGPDHVILVDGQELSYGGGGQSMKITAGVIQAITANRWGPLVYKDTGTSWELIEGTP